MAKYKISLTGQQDIVLTPTERNRIDNIPDLIDITMLDLSDYNPNQTINNKSWLTMPDHLFGLFLHHFMYDVELFRSLRDFSVIVTMYLGKENNIKIEMNYSKFYKERDTNMQNYSKQQSTLHMDSLPGMFDLIETLYKNRRTHIHYYKMNMINGKLLRIFGDMPWLSKIRFGTHDVDETMKKYLNIIQGQIIETNKLYKLSMINGDYEANHYLETECNLAEKVQVLELMQENIVKSYKKKLYNERMRNINLSTV